MGRCRDKTKRRQLEVLDGWIQREDAAAASSENPIKVTNHHFVTKRVSRGYIAVRSLPKVEDQPQRSDDAMTKWRSSLLRSLGALGIAAAVAVPLCLPSPAHAWWAPGWGWYPGWGWRGGVVVGVAPPPVVVAPPAVVVGPPVYAPAYPPPGRVWVRGHWNGPYWVPGHWA